MADRRSKAPISSALAEVDRSPEAAAGDDELEALTAARDDALQELKLLRQRFSLVGAAAKVGFWEYDFERDELWMSDELADLYGTSPEELTWAEFVSRVHPDDVVVPVERPTPSYPFGEVNDFLFRVRHNDGTYRNIRSRSTTHGHDGVPVRKLGAHIDMSDDTLFRLAELSNSNERLRHFSYMASHDLRSPLRAIRNLVTFLVEDHGESLAEDAAEMLAEITTRAERLDRLVVDMLSYASADRKDTCATLTDLGELFQDIVGTTDSRQCRVVVDSSIEAPLNLTCHPLAACVRNLVDNACKHHDKPSGTVKISARTDGTWLRVEVADDGPGVPASLQEHIFEPFRTSDPTTSSGLGLAHVREQVENHNATVDLVTEPGAGTTFILKWPILRRLDEAQPS